MNELIDWVKTTQEKTFKKFPASNDEKTMNENKGIKPQIQVAKETINFSQMNKESGSQGMKTTNKQMDSQNKMKLSDNKLVPTKNPDKRDETHEKPPEKFSSSNDKKTMNENKGTKPQIQVAKETLQMNKESGSQGKTTKKQMDSQNNMKLLDNKLVPTKNPNKRDETHEKQPEKERESWNLKSKKRKY